MKKKICVYDSGGGHELITNFSPWMEKGEQPWVRLTEVVEVNFPSLPKSEVIEKQLEQIDKAEARVRDEFQRQLDKFNDLRGKLQALPATI